MAAPRMTVGVYEDVAPPVDLAGRLAEVGHRVEYFSEVSEAAHFDLVIISVSDQDLPLVAEQMAARARSAQIYLHTSYAYGVQVLDPLEISGALVGAAYPLSEKYWVIGAVDELGETIVELLVNEIGGRAIMVPDSQRLRLAAGMSHLGFATVVRADAESLLVEAIGNETAVAELIDAATRPTSLAELHGATGLAARQRVIEEPGLARSFRELARRHAERSGVADVELWAMGDNG